MKVNEDELGRVELLIHRHLAHLEDLVLGALTVQCALLFILIGLVIW